MKFTMTKIAAGLLLAAAATGAQAVSVTGMTLQDVGSGTNGVYSSTLDGLVGAFSFNAIDPTTYSGAKKFTGANAGVGVIDVTQANAAGTFATSFNFGGTPFYPKTTGPIVADITNGALTVTSLPWAGDWGQAVFSLPPDTGSVQTYFLSQIGNTNQWNYKIGWEHVITAAEDPSGYYVNQNARWIIEGVMTTAPVPEASTYGMMLAGLGMVGGMVARRRRSA